MKVSKLCSLAKASWRSHDHLGSFSCLYGQEFSILALSQIRKNAEQAAARVSVPDDSTVTYNPRAQAYPSQRRPRTILK